MQYAPYEMSTKTTFGLYAQEILLPLTYSFAAKQPHENYDCIDHTDTVNVFNYSNSLLKYF